MNKKFTITPNLHFLSNKAMGAIPLRWGMSHYNSWVKHIALFIFALVLFVPSLSAQQLVNLDDYLSKMKNEPVTTAFLPESEKDMDQAEYVKSQIYNLVSTIYLLDGKITRHQTGRLVRMVTTIADLSSFIKETEKLQSELVSVKTLIVKIPDAGSLNGLQKIESDLLEMLPVLERVFFNVQFKSGEKDIRQLEQKLPDNPTEKNSYKRVPITWLYKLSTPS